MDTLTVPAPTRAGASVAGVRERVAGAVQETGRFLLAFGASLAIYLSTVAPTIYNLDSAELTTAAHTGGLVRATGYPLYLLIGRLWSRLPIGDVGFRMNLLSAVFAALTIAVADLFLRRLRVPGWARLAGLGLLASSRYFWAMASAAEVYTLHTLMMALILLLLLRFARSPSGGGLALCTLTVGVSFGNHVATVLLAPACVWFVLRTCGWRWLTPSRLLAAGAGLAGGLSLYLYLCLLYLAKPAFNYAGAYDAQGVFVPVDLTTVAGMWWLVSGRAFTGAMMGYTATELLHETWHFLAELVRAFLGIGIGPALVGIVALRRRQAALTESLVLAFVCSAGFFVNYRVIDKDTMFLPAYLVWALFLAVGYQALDRWLARDHDHTLVGGARLALKGLAVGAVIFALAWNGPLVDLSSDRSTYNRGLAVMSRAEPNSLIVGWWGTVPILEYLQLVEGRRPDLQPLNRFLIDAEDLGVLVRSRLERDQPVYFDEPPTELFPNVSAERRGPIFRIHDLDGLKTEPPEAVEGPQTAVTEL